MLELLRRPPSSARMHPTPDQAVDSLEAARCMYAAISNCSGPAKATGLRDDDDVSDILICGAHYGRLWRLDARQLDELENYLRSAFRVTKSPARSHEE